MKLPIQRSWLNFTRINVRYHHSLRDTRPFLAPPHPDLVSGLPIHRRLAQNSLRDPVPPLSAPTGSVLGLNDGTIFPSSHFDAADRTTSKISRAALDRAPLREQIKVAVVLVDFPDKAMAKTANHFKELFFSQNIIPTKSVREYYTDVSNGKVDFIGEVVGPLRMPRASTVYAHGDHGLGNIRPNLRDLAADALAAANPLIEFGPYDNDGNGFVDAFVVVHAGSGGEQTGNVNDIWSAKWVLPQPSFVDGVRVYAFLTVPEDARIGVCAHELGHLVFGWPDLYDSDDSSEGIGNWCLMAGGSHGGSPAGTRPCHPSAWCKKNQGWVDEVIESTNHTLTLDDVKTSRQVHRLWTRGTQGSEYFLIENRQRTGFDTSLPGEGLLIWHVDDAKDDNQDERHYKVALEQADGLNQLENKSAGRGDRGDPYPGNSGNTSFTSATDPNSRDYDGVDTKVSITNIQQLANGQMSMDIKVS